MTEIETLRKELNELRERVAVLERSQHQHAPLGPAPNLWPVIHEPYTLKPPFIVTCTNEARK